MPEIHIIPMSNVKIRGYGNTEITNAKTVMQNHKKSRNTSNIKP